MAKLLLVDDSNLARRTLRRFLEPEGHEIIEATDGLTALERYMLDRPDLVLLDLNMPGMQGFEVLQKLRELDPQARVIVASADIQRSTHEIVQSEGSMGFIPKPFVKEQVLKSVAEVLAGGRADHDAY